jgi:hypothetical protein
MIVVNDPCLFASRYYLDVDAGLLPDFADDIRAVAGVAHGRGGACPQTVHIVDADQMPVCFHKPHEILPFLVRHLSFGKYVEAETERYPHQQFLFKTARFAVAAGTLYQQPHGVGADVDGCVGSLFHCLSVCIIPQYLESRTNVLLS